MGLFQEVLDTFDTLVTKENCVTQLMIYTGDKLSSTILLSVSVSGIGNTQPNLHFFQYIQA